MRERVRYWGLAGFLDLISFLPFFLSVVSRKGRPQNRISRKEQEGT
jgi:hypothetical protein